MVYAIGSAILYCIGNIEDIGNIELKECYLGYIKI